MPFESGQLVLIDGRIAAVYLRPDVRGYSRVKLVERDESVPYLFSVVADSRLEPVSQSGMQAGEELK